MTTQPQTRPRIEEFRAGWKALLGCIIGLSFGSSFMLYLSGVFVQALQTEFGWTRSQLSSVNLITVLTVIPLAPFVGMAIDRWGVRLPVVIGMLGLAAGFGAMGLMTGNFLEYLLIYVITSVFGLMCSHIGLTRPISELFDLGRGLALALAMACAGGITALAPMVVIDIVTSEGWRTAFFTVGLTVLVATPFVAVLIGGRRGPARAGGVASSATKTPERLPLLTMLRDPLVLRLSAMFFCMALGVTGYTFHFIPMLVDGGMPAGDAARIQALFGIAIIVGRLVIGPLFDHLFAPWVVAGALSITIAGVVLFALVGPAAAPVFALALGLALGAEGDLIGFLASRYFGMVHYSSYFGVLFGAYLLANGCSPLLISLIAENFGGYPVAIWLSVLLPAIAMVLLLTLPRYDQNRDGSTGRTLDRSEA